MDWIYKSKKMTKMEDFPKNTLGFIYIITDHSNNKFYVGRKSIVATRKRHFGKKEKALITDKRVKLYEMVSKETRGWQNYTGSSELLNEAIEDGARYTKEIVQICYNKSELTYYEQKIQFKYGVIEPGNSSYNSNIAGKYYTKLFHKDEACCL